MPSVVPKRAYNLADQLLFLLLLMAPVMLLVGAAEGRPGGPTPLFWLLLLLPLLPLPWLLACCEPEDTADGARAAALQVPRDPTNVADFAALVAPVVQPVRSYVENTLPVVEGVPQVRVSQLFEELSRRLAPRHVTPMIESVGGGVVRVVGLPTAVDQRLRSRSSILVNILLFAATVVTTAYAGARQQGVNLLENPGEFAVGLPYALSLLAILGIHELGHYMMARRHNVEVTPPYFIPVPMGLGTFGAFIQIKSLITSRRAVFDIGVAGPLAGLFVAVPLLYVGLGETVALSETTTGRGMDTGSSLFLALMYQMASGGDVGAVALSLSPVAFAAWIGIFVTAINLLPVGQLDGGHIAYALFGRRHARTISVMTVALIVVLGLLVWPGLLMWGILISLLAGFAHMPALDDVTPPDGKRWALGVLALMLPVLIMLPMPGALDGTTMDSPYQGRRSLDRGGAIG